MGWKAFVLFATDQPPGYFGGFPPNDPQRAERIRMQLGLTDYETVGATTLEESLNPAKGELFIAAPSGGVVLSHPDFIESFFVEGDSDELSPVPPHVEAFRNGVLGLYPTGQVLAIVLHSVVNLWGYSLFSEGRLIRCASGSAEDGVIADFGEPLPEEQSLLAEHELNDETGEEFVFAVAARFLGKPLDRFTEDLNLGMTEYRKKGPSVRSWWAGLTGARP
jgi:hypothetical protein